MIIIKYGRNQNVCTNIIIVDLNQIVFSLFQYYFYLPILVLLSVNTLLFVLTIVKLWLHAKSVRLATRGSVTSEVKLRFVNSCWTIGSLNFARSASLVRKSFGSAIFVRTCFASTSFAS
jgi:hypothetical protein